MRYNRGFTLIELSIVLVIIGLIIGGVMTGQTLIRQAEIKSVISEYQAFDTATNAYKQKYGALAGDDPRAYSYFGTACGTNSTTAGTGCNGNGNSQIGLIRNVLGDALGEGTKYFEHLAKAGLIPGNFDGSCTLSTGFCTLYANVNSPLSKYGNGVWGIVNGGSYMISGLFKLNRPVLMLMRADADYYGASAEASFSPYMGVFKSIDLYGLDKKIDDGMPNTGNVRTYGSGASDANCVNSAIDTGAQYNFSASSKCTAYFLLSSY